MHLLLAEDDKISRELLRRIIEAESHTVTLAEDGAEAWRLLTESPRSFDAVVFDICMPTVSGMELIEKMRARDDLKKTPVILCSAVSDRLTVQKAAALGVTHYVVKPYSRALMHEKLRQIRAMVPPRNETGVLEPTEVVCRRLGIDPDSYREMVGSMIEETAAWARDLRASTGHEAVEKAFIRGRGLRGSCLSIGLKRAALLIDSLEKPLESFLAAADSATAALPQPIIENLLAELDAEGQVIRSKLKLPKAAPKKKEEIEPPPSPAEAPAEAPAAPAPA
ncbi:MAG TPA: response regulator [Opitutaceae bacterium]|jgi:CheY-like chemotaxis protein|nr:response regulator [Opitutaceae bacterium]